MELHEIDMDTIVRALIGQETWKGIGCVLVAFWPDSHLEQNAIQQADFVAACQRAYGEQSVGESRVPRYVSPGVSKTAVAFNPDGLEVR